MSKRSGDFVTLRDLYEETGVDAARYWFLMRRGDFSPRVRHRAGQGAHRRESVTTSRWRTPHLGHLRSAAVTPDEVIGPIDLDVLADADRELLRRLTAFPRALPARPEHEPHRVTTYLEELARLVHAGTTLPRAR